MAHASFPLHSDRSRSDRRPSLVSSTCLSRSRTTLQSTMCASVSPPSIVISSHSSLFPSQILISLLDSSHHNALLLPILSCYTRYADVWTAMDVRRPFAETLFEKHLELREGSFAPSKELLDVLSGAAKAGLLPEEDEAIVENDVEAFKKVSLPLTFVSPCPHRLTGIKPIRLCDQGTQQRSLLPLRLSKRSCPWPSTCASRPRI